MKHNKYQKEKINNKGDSTTHGDIDLSCLIGRLPLLSTVWALPSTVIMKKPFLLLLQYSSTLNRSTDYLPVRDVAHMLYS